MLRETINQLVNDLNEVQGITEDEYLKMVNHLNAITKLCKVDIRINITLTADANGLRILFVNYSPDVAADRFDVANVIQLINLAGMENNVTLITGLSLYEGNPGEGNGTRELIKYCESKSDNFIMVTTGLDKSLYSELPENYEELLAKQAKFFKRAGFVDISHLVANEEYNRDPEFRKAFNEAFNMHEHGSVMIYKNGLAVALLAQIQNIIDANNQKQAEMEAEAVEEGNVVSMDSYRNDVEEVEHVDV